MRSYKIPPPQVVHILEALMRLQNKLDTSWSNMKKFLAKRTVIDSITSLDPRRVSPKTLSAVKRLLESKPASFDAARVSKISKAAGPFCGFIKAVVRLVETCQEIRPLETELQAVDKKLEEFKWELAKNQRNIVQLEHEKSALEDSFKQKQQELGVLRKNLSRF